MTTQAELHTLAVKVGEISGQLRELIHGYDNLSMKMDGVVERLLTAPAHADIEKIVARVEAVAARLDALEAKEDQRTGERGVVMAILRSPPFMAIVGAIAGAIAALKTGVLK